jgi:hypothetical protein
VGQETLAKLATYDGVETTAAALDLAGRWGWS